MPCIPTQELFLQLLAFMVGLCLSYNMTKSLVDLIVTPLRQLLALDCQRSLSVPAGNAIDPPHKQFIILATILGEINKLAFQDMKIFTVVIRLQDSSLRAEDGNDQDL